jgi:hypothetical protein
MQNKLAFLISLSSTTLLIFILCTLPVNGQLLYQEALRSMESMALFTRIMIISGSVLCSVLLLYEVQIKLTRPLFRLLERRKENPLGWEKRLTLIITAVVLVLISSYYFFPAHYQLFLYGFILLTAGIWLLSCLRSIYRSLKKLFDN